MRKVAQLILAGCLLAMPALSQRGGGGFHGGMGGGFHGGMGGARGWGGNAGFRGGFNGYGGGFRGGYYRGYGGRFGYGWPYWRGYGVGYGVPYWPYYYGSWWGYYGYPSYPYYPDAVYAYPYSYSYPSESYAYSQPTQASCPQANGKALYFIKLIYQDTVWMAQDYWYTADTLNFVTLRGEQNKTPISSIDRNATFELNRQCGVVFQLPSFQLPK